MKTLANFLDLSSMWQRAVDTANELTARPDVPQGPDVPPDLRDTASRFHGLAGGMMLAGRLKSDILLHGSVSSAMPLLAAILAILTALAAVIGFASPVLLSIVLLAMAATLAAVNLAAGLSGVLMLMGMCLACALVGAWLPSVMSWLLPSIMGGGLKFAAIGLLAVAAAAFVLHSLTGRRGVALSAAAIGGTLTLSFVLQAIGAADGVIRALWLLVPCSLPWLLNMLDERNHALTLQLQAQLASAENSGALASSHKHARAEQAKRAAADNSGFIQLGVAKGILTKKHDGFAPDKGLSFGLSPDDVSKHIIVFGDPGSGKTTGFMKPYLQKWCSEDRGGLFILDGKGEFAREAIDYLKAEYGYGDDKALLVQPGVALGLIEGLEPNEIADAFMGLRATTTKSDGGAFFDDMAIVMIGNAAWILQAIIAATEEQELAGIDDESMRAEVDESRRKWKWTLGSLKRMLALLQDSSRPDATSVLNGVAVSTVSTHALISNALQYWLHELPAMDSRERGGTYSTCMSYIAPITTNPELQPWTEMETGVDPTMCLRGGACGVNLPPFKFGKAGTLASILIKNRVYKTTRQRADIPEHERIPVTFLFDEAQELISKAEEDFLPVGRSLKGYCVFATQNTENVYAKLGQASADAVLAAFGSVGSYKSTQATWEFVSKRIGDGSVLARKVGNMSIDFVGTPQRALKTPLYDQANPNARFMARLRRQGFGKHTLGVQMKNAQGQAVGADTDWLSNARVNEADAAVNPLMPVEWRYDRVVSYAEWSAYLEEPGVALFQVNRAGVKRRDFIKTTPVYSLKPSTTTAKEKVEDE